MGLKPRAKPRALATTRASSWTPTRRARAGRPQLGKALHLHDSSTFSPSIVFGSSEDQDATLIKLITFSVTRALSSAMKRGLVRDGGRGKAPGCGGSRLRNAAFFLKFLYKDQNQAIAAYRWMKGALNALDGRRPLPASHG